MKKLAIATLALGALATTFVTPATAAAPSDTDLGCGFTSTTDSRPEAPADAQIAYLDGGPILQNGTITCTVQVGFDSHDDPDNGASASATGTHGVTYLPPTPVSYTAPPLVPVYLCNQFDDGSTTWYWDDDPGEWTTDASADCILAISARGGPDPLFNPVFDLLDTVIDAIALINDMRTAIEKDVVDPRVCPVFATVRASGVDVPGVLEINAQGDVFLAGEPFWDCPPYDLFG